MQQREYLVGVDIGGTKIAVGLLSEGGKIIKETRMDTRGEDGPEVVVKRLAESINSISTGYEIKGVGVGVPGTVDTESGTIKYWSTYNWENIPLKTMLNEYLKEKVNVVNDASAASWGEFTCGAGRNTNNMVFMTISTGIGGGIILERKLYVGSSMLAGEIGHVVVNPTGPTCNCGNYGCLEAYASGLSIQRFAVEAVKDRSSILLDMEKQEGRPIDTKMVFAAYEAGDSVAGQIIEQAAGYIGLSLANIIHTLSPDRIVLGGGVMKSGSSFMKKIEEATQQYVFPSYQKTYEIRCSELFEDAAMIGAAYLLKPLSKSE